VGSGESAGSKHGSDQGSEDFVHLKFPEVTLMGRKITPKISEALP
jgi:hypothetical protein